MTQLRSCTEHQRDAGPMLGPETGPRGSVAPTLRPAARAHRAPVETRRTLSSIYNSRPKPPNPSLRPRHEPTHPPRRGAAHALLVSRGHEVEEKVISINSILPIIYFIYPLLSIIIIYAIMRHICRSARAGRQSGRTTVISCRVFRKGVCKKTTRN